MNGKKHSDRTTPEGGTSKSPKAVLALLALTLMLSSLPAAATVVNMKLTNLPTNHQYAGVYTYPYDLSVNGNRSQWMMCIAYHEEISVGETWKANVVNVSSLDPNTYRLDYEAAFLFKMAEADHGANPSINAAAWWLLEGAPSTLSPTALGLVSLAQKQSYSHGEYSDVLLYRAIPGTQTGRLGTAQDFLGTTPEPGTLALLGSGVLGLGGLLRRRFRSS
jgi:hypothetical protein